MNDRQQNKENTKEKGNHSGQNKRKGGQTKKRKTSVQTDSALNKSNINAEPDGTEGNHNIEVVINRPPNDVIRQTQKLTPKKNILLMGDSILNKINTKGLNDNVHKHSVPGATLPILLKDIDLYDVSNFGSFIIYVGGNDLSETSDYDRIEEFYEQLITSIKFKNSDAHIILSKLAPRGDVDVTIVNRMIERLSLRYNLDFVDNYRAFFDRQGSLIMRYFGQNDQVHPSTTGIKRLIGTINDKVRIVNDFTKVTFSRPGNYYRGKQGKSGTRPKPFAVNNRCLNCYDSSHETFQCRHKEPIDCWYCGNVGHKQEFCWN